MTDPVTPVSRETGQPPRDANRVRLGADATTGNKAGEAPAKAAASKGAPSKATPSQANGGAAAKSEET